MKLTFSWQEHVEQMELDDGSAVEEIESILRAVFPALPQQFAWMCNGKHINPTATGRQTLKQLGLDEDAFVVLVPLQHRPRPTSNASSQQQRVKKQRQAVYFPGMGFQEVIGYNPNPLLAAQVLRAHPELLREMSFHNPQLAQRIQSADTDALAGEVLREIILDSEVARSMKKFEEETEEEEMNTRLKTNPNDEQALKYFSKKTNRALLDQQYQLVMQEYPETLFPVLMLYIDTEINQAHVKAFVDSGAQTSVMTLACAKRCGIDHLIDDRFAGKIVGVGQSSSLGKIMICPIKIGDTYFQMSVTVMDQLGDKNMEFLFGLDMLKRHRFGIDLERGVLTYHGANGIASTPFLHEKDLPMNRGGTQGLQIDEHGMQVGKEEEEEEVTAKDDEFETKLQTLVNKGYPREKASKVLKEQDGDLDTAETLLMFDS